MKNFCEDPLIITSGKGLKVYDVEGKEYLDAISGIFVACIGYGNKNVIEAIKKQHEKISFVAPLHAVCETTVEYAYRLSKIMPGNLNIIKMFCGGSEATEAAMRMARQYHKQTGNPSKYKVIGIYGEFHGGTMGALSSTGLGGSRRSKAEPLMGGFFHVMPPNCFNCPYALKYPECNCLCAKILVKTIENEDPDTVSAVIIEPISNTGGVIIPPQEYFQIIREGCSKYNVLFIYDEIVTGFGRTGQWFAANTFGVFPDIICTGKGMSGGYAPAACIAIAEDLYFKGFWADEAEERQFSGGHTYGLNPISAAACMAVLDEIEEKNLLENTQKMGEYARKRLKEMIEAAGILGDVRGKGLFNGVQFVYDIKTGKEFGKTYRFGKSIEKRALRKGLILRCDSNWIAIAPPLNTTKPEMDSIFERFNECIEEEIKEFRKQSC